MMPSRKARSRRKNEKNADRFCVLLGIHFERPSWAHVKYALSLLVAARSAMYSGAIGSTISVVERREHKRNSERHNGSERGR